MITYYYSIPTLDKNYDLIPPVKKDCINLADAINYGKHLSREWGGREVKFLDKKIGDLIFKNPLWPRK